MADHAHVSTSPPPVRRFEGDALRHARDNEWLLTNGLGGFASGTVSGVPRRRYHAWLIAATAPPVGRVVTLSASAEWIVIAQPNAAPVRYDLSTFAFAGESGTEILSPRGIDALRVCEIGASARWTYEIKALGLRVSRELLLHHHRNAATIHLRVSGRVPQGCHIEVRPLVALRDFHALVQQPRDADERAMRIEHAHAGVRILRTGGCALVLRSDTPGVSFTKSPDAWRNFTYAYDHERGQDGSEHLFSPGSFILHLEAREYHDEIVLSVIADAHADANLAQKSEPLSPEAHASSQHARLAPFIAHARRDTPAHEHSHIESLVRASDQFVVQRGGSDQGLTSIIAGYPWFSDWGRDTMIALPGLLLCTGRFVQARDALLAFARLRRNGLIPNCFDNGTGQALYNTADASLWFLIAVARYVNATNDLATLDSLLPACADVIDAYRDGTDFAIRVDPADGLVCAGSRLTQLTWMDAQRDGVVFTPRSGKPVELSALWYAGLLALASCIEQAHPRRAREWALLADATARSFETTFWNEEQGCLFDLVPGVGGATASEAALIRPNQVFATCFEHSPLSPALRARVLESVHERLVTPFGLRTLAQGSPAYAPRYEGPLPQRDAAYHNGTVWPWLLGPCCEGLLRLNAFSPASRTQVRSLLAPLLAELAGVQQAPGVRGPVASLAEVYDADDVPALGRRRPEGCFAQAWSIAETLRVLLLAIKP